MKKSVKVIGGLFLGATAIGVCYGVNMENSLKANDTFNLIKNEVISFKKANVGTPSAEENKTLEIGALEETKSEAVKNLESAQKEVKTAKKEVKKAEEAVKTAKEKVKNAKTDEEREIALEEVKKAEESVKKAEEAKKAIEETVEVLKEEVSKEVEQKVEEVKEEVKPSEVIPAVVNEVPTPKATTPVEPAPQTETQQDTGRQFTDEQIKYMLEQANKGAARQQAEHEAEVQRLQDEANQRRADRLAREAEALAEQERLEEERRQRESTESLKNWGSSSSDTVYGDREFTFKQEEKTLPFDPNAKENPQTVTCTGDYCETKDPGYIWFARFKSNFSIFKEPGSDNYVNNVKIGKRSDVSSWIQYAPSVVDGHEFDHWSVTETEEDGMTIKVYTAVYR